jgi:hypothetical protein
MAAYMRVDRAANRFRTIVRWVQNVHFPFTI